MGFRFQKRIKLLPGVTLNFSKSGVSTSIGPRGAKVNLGNKGTRVTVGLPGTGLSYSEQIKDSPVHTSASSPGSQAAGAAAVLILLAAVFVWFYFG